MKLKELDIGKFFIFKNDTNMEKIPVYKYGGGYLLDISCDSGKTDIDSNDVAQELYEHEIIEIKIPLMKIVSKAIKQ